MKFCIFYCFLIIAGISSPAQSPAEKLNSNFSKSGLDIPADQVFLHLDRNLYQPGDTIRFQGYIRDRQTGVFETKSLSFYVLLLDKAKRTVDSARFRISNSTSPGWLKVPAEAKVDDYSVIAFTSGMMNSYPQYIFSVPLRIDRLRPAPPSPDQKTSKEKAAPFQLQVSQENIDFRFLPEGGTFIYGIKQRLAFNAVTSVGSQINTDGEIVNQNGERICLLRPSSTGPGVAEFTPLKGSTYFALLHAKEFAGEKWPLPVPENSGISMRVNTLEDGILTAEVHGMNVTGSKYRFSLVMNNVQVLSKEFVIDTLFKIKISTEELPAGMAYITLFSSELKPVAERLVFVNNHKTMKIGIATSASSYKRGEETDLTINPTDNNGNRLSSVISVSVFDSISGFYDKYPFADIESTFLFDKEFYDNLPPRLKVKGFYSFEKEDIDLLLLTYGWRKFKMKEPGDSSVVREIKDYDYLKIENPGPERKTRETIDVMAIEGTKTFALKADANHEAVLPFDSIESGVNQIMVLPDKNSLRNIYPVLVKFPENKSFTNSARQIKIPDKYYETEVALLNDKPVTDAGLDSAIMIDPITIRGNKAPPIVYVSKYQEVYQWANTTTIGKKEMTGCFNLEDIIGRLHPYRIDTRRKEVFLRPGQFSITGPLGGPTPALIVIDDIPLEKNYQLIATMPANQIESVTMLKGNRGYTFFGPDANGGVIFITTTARQSMEKKFPVFQIPDRIKDDLMKPIRIFRSEVEYYIPTKAEATTSPEYQFRPTLLWRSEVMTDGSEPVKIRYPNNMVKGNIIVIVNGVSFRNMVGSNIFRYKIN